MSLLLAVRGLVSPPWGPSAKCFSHRRRIIIAHAPVPADQTSSPGLHLLSESPGYFARLSELALSARLSGARIHDARIAALCLHHGVRELWTVDRDFSVFPQLKARNYSW